MMLETMDHHGVDSFAGRLAAIFQAALKLLFMFSPCILVLWVFAMAATPYTNGLTADFVGISAAIAVCYWFYG